MPLRDPAAVEARERIERADAAARLSTVTLDQFVSVDEPGAAAILGKDGSPLIAQRSNAMVYGDGCVGKTTLVVDLCFHLAAGDDWLGIPVPRKARVLIVENEGRDRCSARSSLANATPGAHPLATSSASLRSPGDSSTETALSTALNTSYMATQLSLFSVVVGIALILAGIGFVILALGAAAPRPKGERAAE